MPYSFFDGFVLDQFNLPGANSKEFISFLSHSKYKVKYKQIVMSQMIRLLNKNVLTILPIKFFCGAKK